MRSIVTIFQLFSKQSAISISGVNFFKNVSKRCARTVFTSRRYLRNVARIALLHLLEIKGFRYEYSLFSFSLQLVALLYSIGFFVLASSLTLELPKVNVFLLDSDRLSVFEVSQKKGKLIYEDRQLSVSIIVHEYCRQRHR